METAGPPGVQAGLGIATFAVFVRAILHRDAPDYDPGIGTAIRALRHRSWITGSSPVMTNMGSPGRVPLIELQAVSPGQGEADKPGSRLRTWPWDRGHE